MHLGDPPRGSRSVVACGALRALRALRPFLLVSPAASSSARRVLGETPARRAVGFPRVPGFTTSILFLLDILLSTL